MNRLVIRPGFVALVCCSAYFGSARLLGVFLLAALLHELGHLAAARMMGLRVRCVILSALGAEICLEERATSFLQDLVLSLSGPAANLLTAALCAFLGRFPILLGASLLLGGFNLLPILPLDGGCGMYALLSHLGSCAWAERLMRWLSRTFSLAVLLCGALVLALDGGKPYLLLLGCWLASAAFFSRRN